MANPNIELVCGGDYWPAGHRRVASHTLRDALELADMGLDEIGLQYHQPKRVTIWRCPRRDEVWGSSAGPYNVDIHIRHDLIQHRRVGSRLLECTLTTGHELTHAIRSEAYDEDTIAEHIASEGLAYSAESMIADMIDREGSYSVADIIWAIGQCYDLRDIKSKLERDKNHVIANDPEPDSTYDAWLKLDGDSLPPGILIGITEVQKRLAEGNNIGDLVSWPAEQILDIAV